MARRPRVVGSTGRAFALAICAISVFGLSTAANADPDVPLPPPPTLWSPVPDSVKSTLLPTVESPAVPGAPAIRIEIPQDTAATTMTSAPTSTSVARCHPSYVDVCLLPDAEDYDCEGGTGNGPLYVRGPFRVVGPDVYDLDGSGRGEPDGLGCE